MGAHDTPVPLSHKCKDNLAWWITPLSPVAHTVRGSASSFVKQARFSSIAVRDPRLFNSLPQAIRNITDCNTDTFKRSFDQFLSGIPDEPLIHGYTKYRRCETNSLVEWCASAQLRQLGDAVPEKPVAHTSGGHSWSQDIFTQIGNKWKVNSYVTWELHAKFGWHIRSWNQSIKTLLYILTYRILY